MSKRTEQFLAILEHQRNEAMAMLHRSFDASGPEEDVNWVCRLMELRPVVGGNPARVLTADALRAASDDMLFMVWSAAFIGAAAMLRERAETGT